VRQSLGLFVSPLNSSTGLGIVTISLAMAIGQFVYGAAQPIFGALMDRAGTVRIIIVGALMMALGLAATPVVWRLGVQADVHALHLAVVALLLLALVGWARAVDAGHESADRWLVGAAALLGLALAGHRLVVFLLPGLVAYVLLVEPTILRRRRLLLGAGGLAIGVAAAFYLELPVRAGLLPAPLVYGHPETIIGFWQVVLGTQFGGVVAAPLANLDAKADALVALAGAQLGPLGPLAALAAVVVALRQPRYAVLTIPAVALTWLFSASYENASIERYYAVPALLAWTWLAIGAGTVVDLLAARTGRAPTDEAAPVGPVGTGGDPMGAGAPGRRPSPGWPSGSGRRDGPPRAATLLGVLVAIALIAPTALALPRRWASVDESGDRAGRIWLEAALAVLPQDSVVVSWWSYSTPLWYAQHIEGRRGDIEVVDDRTRLDDGLGDVKDVIDANFGRRPVYLIRVDQDELAGLIARYRLTTVTLPAGQSLLRVDGPRLPS